jgi:hypothetical protein
MSSSVQLDESTGIEDQCVLQETKLFNFIIGRKEEIPERKEE